MCQPAGIRKYDAEQKVSGHSLEFSPMCWVVHLKGIEGPTIRRLEDLLTYFS